MLLIIGEIIDIGITILLSISYLLFSYKLLIMLYKLCVPIIIYFGITCAFISIPLIIMISTTTLIMYVISFYILRNVIRELIRKIVYIFFN